MEKYIALTISHLILSLIPENGIRKTTLFKRFIKEASDREPLKPIIEMEMVKPEIYLGLLNRMVFDMEDREALKVSGNSIKRGGQWARIALQISNDLSQIAHSRKEGVK
jgi:hypothetical protein